jgi:predicted dehydrogenase
MHADTPQPLALSQSPAYHGCRPSKQKAVTDQDGNRFEERLAPTDHYRLMVESFAEAVIKGAPIIPSANDAVNNMRVLDAIASSARLGQRALVPA